MSWFTETMWLTRESHQTYRRLSDVFERSKEHQGLVEGADQVAITVEQQGGGRYVLDVPAGRNPAPLLRVCPMLSFNIVNPEVVVESGSRLRGPASHHGSQ